MKALVCLFATLVSASSFADNTTNQLPTMADKTVAEARAKFIQLQFSLNNGQAEFPEEGTNGGSVK